MTCPCGRGDPGRPPDPGTCGADYSETFPCPHGWLAQSHCGCAHEVPPRRVRVTAAADIKRLRKLRAVLARRRGGDRDA